MVLLLHTERRDCSDKRFGVIRGDAECLGDTSPQLARWKEGRQSRKSPRDLVEIRVGEACELSQGVSVWRGDAEVVRHV